METRNSNSIIEKLMDICSKCQNVEGKHANVGDFCPKDEWYSEKQRFVSQQDAAFLRDCGIEA